MDNLAIYNYLQVNEHFATSGQPTARQLRALAADGLMAVINLASDDEPNALPNEAGLLRSLGVAYVHIPVAWNDPQESDFAAFEAAMARLSVGSVLLHCAANYRATAFYALYALKHLGWSEAQAEAFRAQIWRGSDYPIWERFIARLKAAICTQG
jgi:uncharacterized protein (TIGR01244 family)